MNDLCAETLVCGKFVGSGPRRTNLPVVQSIITM